MAITQLNKMTLYGAESQKEAVIEQLQELGCAHLVDLTTGVRDYTASDSSKDTREALRYLRECPQQLRQVVRKDRFDRAQVTKDTLELQDGMNNLADERDELRSAIIDLAPWGEFQLPADGSIQGVRFWFYVVRIRDLKKMPDRRDNSWYEISRDNRSAYIVILSATEPTDVPGDRRRLDPRPMSELTGRLEGVEEQLEELQHQRVGLTRWCDLLSDALDEADDLAAREHAVQKTYNKERVFALQGWIPQEATESVRQFAADHQLAVTLEPPTEEDEPPTLLQHPEGLAGSEALVTFYKTPDYRSWDPSILAYISFAIFFAMIIADAGYGIALGIVAAYLWKPMSKTRSGRRSHSILRTLVLCTILYGVMCGSYFGMTAPPDSPFGFKLLDAESQSTMMPLSILIGVIHLSLANLAVAWQHRGRTTAFAPLGWVSVMIGASLAGFAAFGGASPSQASLLTRIGSVLLFGGLLAVFLFTSPRPIRSRSIKNHALRISEGLVGLAGFSGLFGDVLSYLRLFALGLSSAKLAQTFNDLGARAWDEAGFGVIAAIGIIILGHTLNLVLCIMSAVVHGLRLNCIEFFKWALPEEGYLFKPFSKKARQT